MSKHVHTSACAERVKDGDRLVFRSKHGRATAKPRGKADIWFCEAHNAWESARVRGELHGMTA